MLLFAQFIFPVTSEPIVGGAVLVRDGKIVDVGSADMLKLRYPDEETVDFGAAALMPGLVDLHTRLDQAVMRGLINDEPFAKWVVSCAEYTSRLEAPDLYESAILGGLDALSSGITTVADSTVSSATCRAMQELGLRGVVYRQVAAMDKQRIDYAMRAAENDIAKWQAKVDPDRIKIGISPGAVYFNHPAVFGRVSEFATREDLPVAMRLAGSREEFNFVMYGSSMFSVHTMHNAARGYVEIPPWLPTGVTPVRYALNWGAFESPNVMMVHAVHVNDDDIQKMRAYDVSVCVCPRANAQLGRGTAPLGDFLQAGLRVGFGTDSPAATDSTDMISETRMCMLIQRATDRRLFLESAKVLELATLGGARALKMDDAIGSIDIGKRADLIAVDMSSSHHSAGIDPVSTVVNTCSASDVIMTMVDGKVLYEKNRWNVDVEVAKNIARVIEIRSKLRK